MSLAVYFPPGTTGGQARNAILNDPFLSRWFGWMVDGQASGINLDAIRAFNASIRAEILGDRQQCWINGHFVGVTGRCVEDPEEGVAKALAQLNGETPFDPNDNRRLRLEGYVAKEFYREWNEAVDTGQGPEIQAVIDKYDQYSDIMGTNPFVGGMSFSMASNQDIFNRMILGDSDWGATVQFCTSTVTTNCVDPFDIRDLWEDVGRHVQIIFKGLEIPGLPEWLPLPGIMSLPTIGEIFDTVMGPFQEEADRQMQECMGQDDDGDGIPNSASYCIENRSITDIITNTVSDAATGVIDKAGEEFRRILDGELEIPCTDDPQACADKVVEVLGDIFEGVWDSADPTMPGIPDWVRAIIIAGEYGDDVLRGIETATNTDIDGDGTIGLTPEECEEGEADFGNGCEPVCQYDESIPASSPECQEPAVECPTGQQDFGNGCEPICEYDETIAASDPQCVPPVSEVEEQCNAQGKVYDELNDECLEECKNTEYVVGADGNCGPSEEEPEPPPEGCEAVDCNSPKPNAAAGFDEQYAARLWEDCCGATHCPDGSLKQEGFDCNGNPTGPGEDGECDNGATIESECSQCPGNTTVPSWHVDGDCRNPVTFAGESCGENGEVYADNGDCVLPGDPNTPTPDEECAKPDGTPTGATVASGCNQCPDGYTFDFEGICQPDGGSINCAEYNRETNEDGTCGGCLPGFEKDTSLPNEPCVASPEVTCPEGQSFCEDTGQCEPEGTCPSDEEEDGGSYSGGGFGGGGAIGVDINVPGVSADPKLLSGQSFAAQDFLSPLFTGGTGQVSDFPIARFLQGLRNKDTNS